MGVTELNFNIGGKVPLSSELRKKENSGKAMIDLI